jgi:hypothetical protein
MVRRQDPGLDPCWPAVCLLPNRRVGCDTLSEANRGELSLRATGQDVQAGER